VGDRTKRLSAIERIIGTERVRSQEELLRLLEQEGFSVTQATLSRDLKLLKVGKVSEGESGYYYTLPPEADSRDGERNYIQDIRRGYMTVQFNGNVGILRTISGHADSVALAIDGLEFEEVLGTVAGDDTIIIVLAPSATPEDFRETIRRRVPGLEE